MGRLGILSPRIRLAYPPSMLGRHWTVELRESCRIPSPSKCCSKCTSDIQILHFRARSTNRALSISISASSPLLLWPSSPIFWHLQSSSRPHACSSIPEANHLSIRPFRAILGLFEIQRPDHEARSMWTAEAHRRWRIHV